MATDGVEKMTDAHGDVSSSGLYSRFRAGTDTLVVVFSQVRVPQGKFGLERMFAGTTHSLLFFNEPANGWYRGREEEIDRRIGEARVHSGATRVILYGSSMGAFGAAAAAARWTGAELYAFAPDWRIGEPGSQSAAAGLPSLAGEPDLGTLLSGRREGQARVIVGLFDPYDAGVGARLAGSDAEKVELVPLRSSHELHDHLYSLNVIRKVTATFRREIAVEAAARGLLVDGVDWQAMVRLAAARLAFDAGEDADPREVMALLPEVNPGLTMLAAEAAARRGEIDRAARLLAALDGAIAADPVLSGLTKRYLKDVPRRRIALLTRLGDAQAALAVAKEAALRFPGDQGFAAAAAVEA